MAQDCFLEYQSSYISFKTILYSRWGHCEYLKRCIVTEANRRRAANKCKAADPILHREPPFLKNCNNATGDFKNLKSVGVP
jgi:hypothetical protein